MNMAKNLMMPAKLATPGLFKNKGYDVIIADHQQNFITLLKSYCRCGHVNKFW